jgi:hypothetical protein
LTLAARCKTSVPATLSQYFSQQLRWRRSAIIDYSAGLTHIWRLNPLLAIHFTSIFALLVLYPVAVVHAVLTFKLIPALVFHLKIVLLFGIYYRWRQRDVPVEDRVGILAILPLAIILPLSYALQTPLALLTLDSGSWETRKITRHSHDPSQARSRGRGNERRASRKSA